MRDLNLRAIGRGAIITAVIAVPAGIAQNLIDRASSVSFALFLVVVLALGLGGWVAGRDEPTRALTHGGLAALTVYLAVQSLGIVLRLARGENVTWISIPLVALLAVSCGVIGGYVAFRQDVRRRTGADDADPANTKETT